MLSIKLATFLVLIKSYKISFIIVWNVTGEFVSSKNINVGLNDSFRVIMSRSLKVDLIFISLFHFIFILFFIFNLFSIFRIRIRVK